MVHGFGAESDLPSSKRESGTAAGFLIQNESLRIVSQGSRERAKPTFVVNEDGYVCSANRQFQEQFRLVAAGIGQHLCHLDRGQWDTPVVHQLLDAARISGVRETAYLKIESENGRQLLQLAAEPQACNPTLKLVAITVEGRMEIPASVNGEDDGIAVAEKRTSQESEIALYREVAFIIERAWRIAGGRTSRPEVAAFEVIDAANRLLATLALEGATRKLADATRKDEEITAGTEARAA